MSKNCGINKNSIQKVGENIYLIIISIFKQWYLLSKIYCIGLKPVVSELKSDAQIQEYKETSKGVVQDPSTVVSKLGKRYRKRKYPVNKTI